MSLSKPFPVAIVSTGEWHGSWQRVMENARAVMKYQDVDVEVRDVREFLKRNPKNMAWVGHGVDGSDINTQTCVFMQDGMADCVVEGIETANTY